VGLSQTNNTMHKYL